MNIRVDTKKYPCYILSFSVALPFLAALAIPKSNCFHLELLLTKQMVVSFEAQHSMLSADFIFIACMDIFRSLLKNRSISFVIAFESKHNQGEYMRMSHRKIRR